LEGEVTAERARALGTLEEREELGLALGRVLERDALIEVDRSGLRVAMAGTSEVGIARAMASVPGLRVEGPVVAAVTGEREEALRVARELRDRWAHAGCDALLLDEEQAEETRVTIDRARAGELGVEASDIANAIEFVSERGVLAGTMEEGGDSIPIVLRLEGQPSGARPDLANLLVPARRGTVPLASVARIEPARGPVRLVRRDGIPSVEIAASGERAREAFDETARRIRLPVDVVVSLETTRGAERL
ncbi:MAG: efflux RND transporter permease subunit, partial [Sandaracinaceae bacterium]|nr:efflux RND transporter permease subunit [Sandaracinaceae bacterium]